MPILVDLLSIKKFRENKAELAVRMQRAVVEEAVAQCEQAKRQLEDFRDWADQRERELFNGLCQRIVQPRDIEDVRLTITEMRGQEHQYVREYEHCDERRSQEEQELANCRAARVEASRMKEKFVELVHNYYEEELRELERREDAELDEVVETRRGRTDGLAYTEEMQ